MSSATDPWGRVDEDGTVYVRTADGERVVGSWQAGPPDEPLAHFTRQHDPLVTEIGLLEQRVRTTDIQPSQAQQSIDRLREAVAVANAVGDLDALARRLDNLTELVGRRREEVRAQREQQRIEARGSSPRPSGSPPRRPTGRTAASGCASWSRSGRSPTASTGRPRPRCGSGCRPPATRSPSAARRTSPPWTTSASSPARRRSGWSPRPRRCPARPTGARRPPPTAT